MTMSMNWLKKWMAIKIQKQKKIYTNDRSSKRLTQ